VARGRVGFYGGSFNPVHYGHMTAMLLALEVAELDFLVVAPVFKHPDGKELAPYEDRLKMLRLATEREMLDRVVVVSRAEESAYAITGTGHTADTLQMLLDRAVADGEDDVIVLVMGSDLKPHFPKWAGYDRIQDMVRAGRVEVLFLERSSTFSSTLVRAAIKHGLHVKRMLPRRIHDYIVAQGLYK
jgi:nicotinate-nucleotide adenylyltransferase